MLTRAGRRRHALRIIEHAADQIQLPWLCPLLESARPAKIQKRSTATRPALAQPPKTSIQHAQARSLASAAPIFDEFDGGEDYLPFSYERQSSSSYRPEQLPPYDLSQILMMDHTTLRPSERLESYSHSEIRGDAPEVEATLEACLQVQRWDRAFTILGQIRRVYSSSPRKLQEAYNRVLEAMVFDLVWNRNRANTTKINRWIEVDMRQAGVDPNAQTFALKIKAALATLEGSRRDRTVRRYWEMAKDYQFESHVASLRNILSDSDLGKLTEICPLQIDFELRADTFGEEQQNHEPEQDLSAIDLTPVRETDQKGLGLVSLKKALNTFAEPGQVPKASQLVGVDDAESVLLQRQRQLEHDSMESAIERWKIEHEKRIKMGVNGSLTQGKIGALLWQWHESIAQKLRAELELLDAAEQAAKPTAEQRVRCEVGPFLRLLDTKHLAALTAISVLQAMSKAGVGNPVKLARLVTELGRTVQQEVDAQRQKNMRSLKRFSKTASRAKATTQAQAEKRNTFELHESGIHSRGRYWSVAITAKIGSILCEMLFDSARIVVPEEVESGSKVAQPVFLRQTIYHNGRKVGTVALLPYFRDLLAREPAADMIAKQMPMISKPRAWTDYSTGGYLEAKQPVLRIKFDDHAQRDYAKAAAERGDLDQMFTGLDVLGSTPWKINRNVYQVMLEAWNSGKAIANLSPIDKVFPEIPKPTDDAPSIEKWRYYSKLRTIENERGGLHSNRCFQNFQMEIAKAYQDEVFYLPHNVDFRGRAYPIPPYLNQMGADNARGLLLFANGRELGTNGLKWLQVHLSNVFGYDKASLSDRSQFAVDNLDNIRDSVDNPLNGRRWWLEAEDPWQCLAACHELVAAVSSPDPTKFVSHLPIHQDGTCNGLQHYAALGGDIAGARQVNLEPGDKPADVYTGVAELVRSEIRKDAEAGVELAKILDGRLVRKIVKQTVMTNVYGVTFTGAIRQVRRQVDDILPDLQQSGHAGPAATYIARKIFAGLGTLFEGAHKIQYWLGDCAQRITHSISPTQMEQIADKEFGTSKSAISERRTPGARRKQPRGAASNMIDGSDFRSTVVWTTPLKLPVVQPYRNSHARVIETNLQNLTLAEPCVADAVDPRKQLQGFPPNFVHSLDATHMMLSAIRANELGLTFSAVHDSFWTHAADIDSLSTLLRDEFVRMHSEDIIGRLRAEFEARYNGHLYLAKIGRNNVLAKKILEHRRSSALESKAKMAVKQRRYHELVQEIKRLRLLASDDPKEQAEGKAMVTAATLFEQHNGDRYLSSKVSLGQTAIGEMPDADPQSVTDALAAGTANDDVNLERTLEPLLPVDSDPAFEELSAEPKKRRKSMSKKLPKGSTSKEHVWLWLPLTFKDVPEKGEFDVKRLKDSTYFFS